MKFVVAIVLFSVIILFHEWGHFLLAKKNGIRVNEFCLGLGPTIVGFTRGETKYSIKLLPFGGACMMEGEDGESDDQRSFNSKSPLARISVVVAGPVFNFLMAFVFSVILIGCHGFVEPVVKDVMEGYPAQESGITAGDRITKLDHKNIHFYEEVSAYLAFHTGQEVQVTYERDGKSYETTLSPRYDSESGRYLIGLYSSGEYVKTDPLQTLKYGALEMKYWVWYTVNSLKMLVTGRVSVNDMSGPVGIVTTVANVYDQSRADGFYYVFLNMLNIGILLSANLGVMNLLPIPALDGGRLVFLVIELIRGKKVDPNREGMVHFIGLMCLFGLMILIMMNDVRKLL